MKLNLQIENQFHMYRQVALTIDTFEILYNHYVGQVYQKCLSMTKDTATAEDFTQDIFIKVYYKMDSFQNRSNFSTWLYAVSHNYCVDKIRHGKRFSTESLSDIAAATIADQDQSASVDLRLQALASIMNKLPAEEVAFLRLKHEENRSIKEIAEQYHLTESAVKMRLKRTRDKLYELYSSHNY